MKILLSPTKTMVVPKETSQTKPLFEHEATNLKKHLDQALAKTSIQSFYKVSDKKADAIQTMLNQFELSPTYPAIKLYDGLVFKYLDIESLDAKAAQFLEAHLYILSGLYGLLRPNDGIKPYRLDFENPLKIEGSTLSAFWAKKIATHLNQSSTFLLNLASKEYITPLLPHLTVPLYTLHFKEKANEKLTVKATSAKMARGAMTREIAKYALTSLSDIKALKVQGFSYSKAHSSDYDLSFIK